MNLQPLARLKMDAAFFTPLSNSLSIPGLTSICAISRIMVRALAGRASYARTLWSAVSAVKREEMTGCWLFGCLLRDINKASRLAAPQRGVMPIEPQQPIVRPLFYDTAAIKDD